MPVRSSKVAGPLSKGEDLMFRKIWIYAVFTISLITILTSCQSSRSEILTGKVVSSNYQTLQVLGGPNVNDYEVIGTLSRGTKVTVIGKNGDYWYLIESNGKKGWLQSFYIDLNGSPRNLKSSFEFPIDKWETGLSKPSTGINSNNSQLVEQGISPIQASAYIGERGSVKIDHAYCDYRPDLSGNPTFCNDKPYPNHNFTMLAWEKNLEYLDGLCIIVTGTIEEYQGIPQIVVSNTSQITYC